MALHFSGRDKDGTHRISGSGGYPFTEKPEPKNMITYLDFEDKDKMIRGNKIPYTGEPKWTDLSSVQVIRNGFTLDESEYYFDLENRFVVLSCPIQSTDEYIEVRSKLCNAPATILEDVLILPVSKYISRDILHKFLPTLGDEVSVERLVQYNAGRLVEGLANIAEVITANVKEDGLYATVKFTIKQEQVR